MNVEIIDMDLAAPWGPEDAAGAIEQLPAPVLYALLRQVDLQMHSRYGWARSRAKRRPWCWHKLRALRREEDHSCAELARRANLIMDVARAREAE